MADIEPNTHLPPSTLIKQPVNADLRVEQGVAQLTERWKGLYTWCTAVAASLYSTDRRDYSWFTANAGTLCAEYSHALPPLNCNWYLGQAQVDECDAGENGILQITWNALSTISGDYPVSESWNLQWQPENYDPYAYCKNPAEHQAQAANGSQRVAVEQCLHPPIGQNAMTQNKLFAKNSGEIVQLNDNEKKILGWKLEGKHVIKHHPIITKTKVWRDIPQSQLKSYMQTKSSEISEPDVIDTPDSPFTHLTGYTWVSQGSNVQTQQQDIKQRIFQLQINTSWTGALSVVPEFYGPEAWTFGEM